MESPEVESHRQNPAPIPFRQSEKHPSVTKQFRSLRIIQPTPCQAVWMNISHLKIFLKRCKGEESGLWCWVDIHHAHLVAAQQQSRPTAWNTLRCVLLPSFVMKFGPSLLSRMPSRMTWLARQPQSWEHRSLGVTMGTKGTTRVTDHETRGFREETFCYGTEERGNATDTPPSTRWHHSTVHLRYTGERW